MKRQHSARVPLAVSLLSLALGAIAQAVPVDPSHSRPDTSSATASNASSGKSANLSGSDRKFVEKAAQGGLAEVDLGTLAQGKAANDQVKQFAQRIVTDHRKGNDQLEQLASSKGVELPNRMENSAQREKDKLEKHNASQFDREYMSYMVKDHKKDIKEFEKEAKSGKDPDVKKFASDTLPTLREHLQLAQAAEAAAKGSEAKPSQQPKQASAGSMKK